MNNVVFCLCILLLLLFGCADLERNKFYEGDDDGGVVGGVSNSSGGTDKGNDINNYRTVVIGTQTWMAENLNYNVSGSKCYNNLNSNCDIYGRLYNWSTAMALPASCNASTCSGQIRSPNQGICPDGWHIPSDTDWDVLMSYAGGSSVAGAKLKSVSGWNNNGNGTDQYGFSALPGGYGNSGGSFDYVGNFGVWWSANEYNSGNAHDRLIDYIDGNAYWGYDDKPNFQSVRCVKDSNGNSSPSGQSSSSLAQSSSSLAQSSSSSVPSSSSLAPSSSSLAQSSSSSVPSSSSLAPSSSSSSLEETCIDTDDSLCYDGQAYKTVTIGTQTWMAKNLNYNPRTGTHACYDNQTSYCNTYGRLYDWATAMVLPTSCNTSFCSNQIQSPHQGICPDGWHIPSNAEWRVLLSYVQGYNGCVNCATALLKATSGWSSDNGTDEFDFTALPGGRGYGGSFYSVGSSGCWWSTSEEVYDIAELVYKYQIGDCNNNHKRGLNSIRCVKD